MKMVRFWGFFFTLLLLGGCSWWDSEEQIEPAELVSIDEERKVKKTVVNQNR